MRSKAKPPARNHAQLLMTLCIETIRKAERPYFVPPESLVPEAGVIENILTGRYQILTPQFASGLKWRLAQGPNRIWASLDDEDFLRRVTQGEVSFTCGDVLEVQMRTVETMEGGTPKVDYHIVKVVNHHKRAAQASLFAESQDAEAQP